MGFSCATDTSRAGYSRERGEPTAFLSGSDIEIMRAMLVAAKHKSRSPPA